MIFFLNIKFKKTNYYNNLFEDVLKFEKMGHDLNYVNTGSTFANYAFDYKCMNLNGFNFAINGQNLEYDLKLLKHYKKNIGKGAKVFIVCADLELVYTTSPFYYRNVRFYKYYRNILSFKEVPFIMKYYIGYILLPVLYKLNSIKYIFFDCEKYNKRKYDTNPLTEEQVRDDALKRIHGWEKMFGISDWKSQNLSINFSREIEENLSILRAIIKLCKNNQWIPYIVIPPVSKILNDFISEEFVKQNLLYYLEQLATCNNIQILNYSMDKRFQELDLYINSACLNNKGRKLFMETLLTDINR